MRPMAGVLQLPLLKDRYKTILLGAIFQYVHGIFTQLAHRMHRPQVAPLHDVGFAYLPVRLCLFRMRTAQADAARACQAQPCTVCQGCSQCSLPAAVLSLGPCCNAHVSHTALQILCRRKRLCWSGR